MSRSELIRTRLESIREKLHKTNLVAVSKYTDLESIQYAYQWGQKDFGENKVQDLKEKAESLPKDIRWHFMGRLQSNKVNALLKTPGLSYIHSVDSLKTLESLYKKKEYFIGKSLKLFLQVKTSDEKEKAGFENYDSLAQAVNFIKAQTEERFLLYGLMTMGKVRTENFEEEARASFSNLLEIKKRLEDDFALNPLKLSMGMSQDFHLALEMGSDYIRLGSLIFSD